MAAKTKLFLGTMALSFAATTLSSWQGWYYSPFPLFIDKLAVSALIAFGVTALAEYSADRKAKTNPKRDS